MRSRRIPTLFISAASDRKFCSTTKSVATAHHRGPQGSFDYAQDDKLKGTEIMLIFEQLVSRGLMAYDPNRKVLAFHLPALAKFPMIRQHKIEEFKWLIGEWAFENHVRATTTTPAYTDTYFYTYDLAEDGTRYTVSGHGAKARPYLTFDPFSNRWMMTFTEGLFGVLQSEGWRGDTIIFTGPLTMLGVDCELRQTVMKKNADEFHILNEERLPDGTWHETDEFNCRRKLP